MTQILTDQTCVNLLHPCGTKEAVDKELIDSIKLPDRTHFNAMLSNGARFYIGHALPEYSTPECASLRELIAADVAGQVFLAQAAEQVNRSLMPGQRFSLYRNNTDFHGTSYGCHENFQMDAPVYEALFGNQQHLLFKFLTPYLVARQIFCGAGKDGSEAGNKVDYQISSKLSSFVRISHRKMNNFEPSTIAVRGGEVFDPEAEAQDALAPMADERVVRRHRSELARVPGA